MKAYDVYTLFHILACSTWNQCNIGHHERYVGNLKGILFTMTVCHVLHHLFGNLEVTIISPSDHQILVALQELSHLSYTHSRKNITNISSQPLKANAVFGLWGNFHIFSFLGVVGWFGFFAYLSTVGRSGGATAGGPKSDAIGKLGKVEVSIWLFIKDTVKC